MDVKSSPKVGTSGLTAKD
uniref:Uncharacterized protein n=1 Tax=Anguilla anguilla TaxID=7936 RepID=A0A0E9PDC8_ANGAN